MASGLHEHGNMSSAAAVSAGRKLISQKYYLIKPPIGEGSFAKVYKGKNHETDEDVAIKEISWIKIRRRSPEFIARHNQNLKNETDCLQSLDHPNIVKLLGGDLAQAMAKRRQEPVEEKLTRGLIKQLAAGLQAIRKLNWVHRDLKPGNLLLSRATVQEAAVVEGGLKIGDFGFARDLAPEGMAETWVGSRLYMAPEILFNASGGYTAKADLWSVGCIMFELLHGRAPYGSRAKSTEAHLKEDIKNDAKYQRDPPVVLSDTCRDLLDRLLQRNPAERATYEEFFDHSWISRRPAAPAPAPVAAQVAAGGVRMIAGKYVLLSGGPLGEGSFATVYKGKNPETEELVAIKEVSWIKIRRRSPEFIARHNQNLKNETDCLQALDHPNIVKLLAHENTPDYFYMVLEFCAGGDLALAMAKRRQEPVEEQLARGLVKQLAAGLQAVRKLNWVHRDLKPGNLLLSRATLQEAAVAEGGLKIGDFGFARDLAPESLAETWVGSRLYMAPEILFMRESGGYTAKADLWSVGCIMFELLHGRAPYGSRQGGTEADLKRDIKNDAKYQRDPPVVVSDACRDLYTRLLQPKPESRLGYEELFDHRWLAPAKQGSAASAAAGAVGGTSGGVRVVAKKYVMLAGPPLGEGSFATVYRGKNQETEEGVAIKEVSWVKIRRRSPEFIARHNQNLKNETDCLRSLDHPNIVKLLGFENTSKHFYMVLELCAGGDLAVAMKRRGHEPVEEAVAYGLVRQLAAGLQAIRKLNWVHRDLKPGNLLLSRATLQEAAVAEGGLKIGDFGFARDLAPESLAETWVGSRLYMAPEILFNASGGYTAKADLWSVGCIMFELLHGRAPYGSRAKSTEAHLKEDIRRNARYTPDPPVMLSDLCQDLLNRLLQPNPVERASYEELFRHGWLAPAGSGSGALSGGSSVAGSAAAAAAASMWAGSACIGFGAAAAAGAAAGGESQMRMPTRTELVRSRLLVVSEALEGPPPHAAGGWAEHGGGYGGGNLGGGERWRAQQGRSGGGTAPGGRGGWAGGGGAGGHGYGGEGSGSRRDGEGWDQSPAGRDLPVSFEEGFELIGDSNLDPIIVESPGDHWPAGRREAAQIIESLPAEVAALAMEVESLRRDVLSCTHAVVQLADEELEMAANPRPAYGLCLYLWSVRLLHRCLSQLHHVQNRYGDVFPPALVTAWKESLRERLSDDFGRAKGALRMCLLSSAAAGAPWAAADGQLTPSALSLPAAPAPQRLAYGAAIRVGRRAATDELLVPLPWPKAREFYCQGLLLLCALLLDCGGSGGNGKEEAAVVESYAGLYVRRILSEPDVPQAMSGQECLELLRRCAQPGRLRYDLPPPDPAAGVR